MPAHAGGGRGGPVRARPPTGRPSCHATERCEEVVLSRRNDSPPEASPARVPTAQTSRRDFLKKAGTAGVLLGSGSALLSACSAATGTGGSAATSASKGTIKILLWSHFVPRYDTWYDPWAKKWGEQNGVNVVVDHIDQADLATRTAAEFAAGAGHDMIEWLTPASAYEPSVHDLTDVVKQAEAKYGSQTSFCKLSSFNPHTSKYYAFCHTWTPDPGDYRKGLWTKAGMAGGPTTYADLLTGGTEINHKQHVRMGIGMSSEVDSNMAARALIWSYGGSTQDAQGNVVLNSPETVDAVAYMVKLFKQTMTDEVFSWTAASNNQGLVDDQRERRQRHLLRARAQGADREGHRQSARRPQLHRPQMGDERRQGQAVPARPGGSGAQLGVQLGAVRLPRLPHHRRGRGTARLAAWRSVRVQARGQARAAGHLPAMDDER